MAHTIEKTITLTDMNCGECGIDFAIPEWFRKRMKASGNTWYCPAGHARVYRESDVDEAKRILKEERLARAALEDQLAAAKRETKRMAKRAANGVCPCCNRSFVQLQRHMKSQHPEFDKVAS